MADIAMCSGKGCPLKERCYRYTAPVNPIWQSYFTNVPYKNGECEYYWDNSYKEQVK